MSEIPSGWLLIGDQPITLPDNTAVLVRGRYGDIYGPIPAEMIHPDAWAGNMLHASHDIVAVALAKALPTPNEEAGDHIGDER